MQAMTAIRPEICHAVGLVSGFQFNLGKERQKAIKRIFRYLQGTKTMKLCFVKSDLVVKGSSDDRKSTSSYIFLFSDAVIS